MDIENRGTATDVSSDVGKDISPTKGRQSTSPRKRAFREVNEPANVSDDKADDISSKRKRLQPATEDCPVTSTAHVAWKLETGSDGGALLVGENQIILGTTDGRVIYCNPDGHVTKQIPVTRPVGALLQRDDRLYVWCYARKSYEKWKGALIDMSFDTPMVLFDIEDFGDHCIHADMVDGCLAVVDNNGNVGLFGCDGAAIWKKEHLMLGDGGFLLADESGVYVAHKKVVRCYSLAEGDITWEFVCPGGRQANISRGYKNGDFIYVESSGKILQLRKEDGTLEKEFTPYRHQGAGVCTGSGIVITGNNPTVIFDQETGKELYRVYIPARLDHAITLMSSDRHLYLFWDQLYCINMTEQALREATEGKYFRTFSHKVPDDMADLPEPITGTLTDNNTIDGVIVTCSEDGQSSVKVTVTSEGYNADWPVLLPRDVREPGKQFVVEKLVPSELGQFYRVTGTTIAKYLPADRDGNGVGKPEVNENSDRQEVDGPTK